MSLSPDERNRYIPIIDSILAASDLNTISEKRIRKGLQAAVDHDLNIQKDAIKALIMERFDKKMADENDTPQTNGHSHGADTEERSSASSPPTSHTSPSNSKKHRYEEEEDDMSEVIDTPKPKKKRKPSEDTDAAYAAKLQAMENARSRTTRGGGSKPSKIVKKKKATPKKKSSGLVKAEDDSDIDGSGSEVKERKVNRNTGFHKELLLSAPLSALLDNEIKLSRPQTVKRIWEYVRAKDLQDQSDKRMIICDDAMRAVFKQDKIHMFTMNKILNQNLYPQDE